nr:hypothetical protein [Tanacetum cinerariifolium]
DGFSLNEGSCAFHQFIKGGGSVGSVSGTVWWGVVKGARCRSAALVVVVVAWVVPRSGPIIVKTELVVPGCVVLRMAPLVDTKVGQPWIRPELGVIRVYWNPTLVPSRSCNWNLRTKITKHR